MVQGQVVYTGGLRAPATLRGTAMPDAFPCPRCGFRGPHRTMAFPNGAPLVRCGRCQIQEVWEPSDSPGDGLTTPVLRHVPPALRAPAHAALVARPARSVLRFVERHLHRSHRCGAGDPLPHMRSDGLAGTVCDPCAKGWQGPMDNEEKWRRTMRLMTLLRCLHMYKSQQSSEITRTCSAPYPVSAAAKPCLGRARPYRNAYHGRD